MSYSKFAKHKCGHIQEVPHNDMDFLTKFIKYCPRCGEEQEFRDFETFVGKYVWKAVWYKPWTWFSFVAEEKQTTTKEVESSQQGKKD